MSIDRQLLYAKLMQYLTEHYQGDGFERLARLCQIVILHDPTENCLRHGELSDWDRLPSHKSLFHAPYGV